MALKGRRPQWAKDLAAKALEYHERAISGDSWQEKALYWRSAFRLTYMNAVRNKKKLMEAAK